MKEEKGYQVDVREESGCKLVLTITVDKEQVQKAYKQAIKRVNKEISLPGFRKGKAPDDVVIQKYSAPVEREWKEIVVNDAFQAGLQITKRYPYNKNTVDKPKIDKCSLEEGAKVTLSYECYPHIPEVKFSDLHLPKVQKREIKQEEVDEILREVKQAHAGWEEIQGRSPQEGDYVDISIDKIDEEPPHSLVQKRRFEISPVMVSWLKALLLSGITLGSSVEGQTYSDERATEEEKKTYQPIKVRVTLHAIQKILLPEVDDELAKKTGASNKEDLIAKIRSNLDKDAETKLKEEKIRLLENLLIEKYPFEIPSSLLTNEIEARTNEKVEELKNQKMTDEQIEQEREKIAKWARENAEHSLRLHFLLAEIGQRGNVRMSKDELNEKLNNEILRNPYYHGLVKENNEMLQNIIRRLSTHFQQEKIREYALSQVEGIAD